MLPTGRSGFRFGLEQDDAADHEAAHEERAASDPHPGRDGAARLLAPPVERGGLTVRLSLSRRTIPSFWYVRISGALTRRCAHRSRWPRWKLPMPRGAPSMKIRLPRARRDDEPALVDVFLG